MTFDNIVRSVITGDIFNSLGGRASESVAKEASAARGGYK